MKSKRWTCITMRTLLVAFAIPLQMAAQNTRYTVTDLPTLGGTFTGANGMNNKGWVAGGSNTPGDAEFHAVLWRNGQITDLGTLGGPISSATDRISESGEISGFSITSIPDTLEGGFKTVGFLWRQGVMTPLPSFDNSGGAEVNNRGQVVGTAEVAAIDPTCTPPEILQSKPVIWYRGSIQILPTFPGDLSGLALGINDEGIAVGTSGICVEVAHLHALLWENGELTNLGNLGGSTNNEALGVNNQRQVVGRSGLPDDGIFHAFLWENGVMTDLGTLPGDSLSFAFNINSKGQLVGTSCDLNFNCRAYVWQNGVMTDLNTLVADASDFFLISANDINDRGQIVGNAFKISTGESHAFLATSDNGRTTVSATAAARGQSQRGPEVVLPANIRKMLRESLAKPYLRGGFGDWSLK